ncbi:MAG: hypothetical protein HYY02_05360 [Chloroflexi bacterium]|nr:hypothetical protein [Chloroflexota bacterium]
MAFYYLISLGALGFVGYAPARLLLREESKAHRWLFLPLLGLSAIAVLSSYLNTLLLPMAAATWVILGLAGVANTLLVLRTRRLGLPRPSRVELFLGLLMAAVYALGVAPLVHADIVAFLGVQWDLEIYLPLTEYLKRYAIGPAIQSYPNPLLEAINSPAVRGGSGWGFSYLEAFLGTLVAWPSFQSFRPTLHLVFSLSIPAVYLFARLGLGMRPGVAGLAAALAGANGLNLWLASTGLAGHATTFVTLPLALATAHLALRERSWRAITLSGLTLAAMQLAFYTGALAVFGAAMSIQGLVALAVAPERRRLLLAAAGILAGAGLFGLVAHLRFLEVLPFYFRDGLSEGWHLREFTSLSTVLGLTPFSMVLDRLGEPAHQWTGLPPEAVALWATGLTLGAGLLTLAALLRPGWQRGAFLCCLAGFIALGVYLRWRADYPYGYFKLVSLASFLLLCGVAQGLATLWQSVRVRPGGAAPSLWLRRGLALGYALVVLPLLVTTTAQAVRFFWEPDPDEMPRSVWGLQRLGSLVPEGAPVHVTGRSGYDPRIAAMLSFFLLDAPVVGNMKTAYGQARSARPDDAYDYLMLQPGERPEERGLRPQDLVWQHELVALYRRPERWLAAIDLEATNQALPVVAHQPLALSLGAQGWSLSNGQELLRGGYSAPASLQQVELTLLAFDGVTASLRTGPEREQLAFPSGLVSYRTQPVTAPGTLELAVEQSERPLWLLGLRVLKPEGSRPEMMESRDILLLQPRLEVRGSQVEVTLDYRFRDTRGGHVALGLEVYQRTPGGRVLHPGAAWRLNQGKGQGGDHTRMVLDVDAWSCGPARPAGGPTRPANPAGPRPPGDGVYEVHLAGYYVNEEVLRWHLLSFEIRGGRAKRLSPRPFPPYAVSYLPDPQDVGALARAMPPRDAVFVPPQTDPDHSFIPVAVATLRDRRFVTDAPGGMGSVAIRGAGQQPLWALLPAGQEPELWGYRGAQRVWFNEAAALYRRSSASALARFQLAASNDLLQPGASQALRGTLAPREVTLEGVGVAAYPEPVARLRMKVTGLASRASDLEVRLEGQPTRVGLIPGYFEYWTRPISADTPAGFSISASGSDAVTFTSLEVHPPTGDAEGLRPQEPAAYVEARSSLVGDTARVALRYWGVQPEAAVLGVDVYGEGPCDLAHYGWWATPLRSFPDAGELLLDLPRQAGSMQTPSGAPLFTDHQSWAVPEGTYRAFLLFKHGDQFDTAPVFEFTVRKGRVAEFQDYPVARLFSLVP